MMEWEAQRIEASGGFGDERPDPGDGDDTCKHGVVVYGEGDCDRCDEEQEDTRPICSWCGGEGYTSTEPGPCRYCRGEGRTDA